MLCDIYRLWWCNGRWKDRLTLLSDCFCSVLCDGYAEGYGDVMVDGKLNRLTLLSDFFSHFLFCAV